MFGTIKYRTADILEFRIFQYRKMNNSIFFIFEFIFSFLHFFKLFEHSKYMIKYEIGFLKKFHSFPDYQIVKICKFAKSKNFRISIL